MSFYDSSMLRECNLNFIDLRKITPPAGVPFVWISFVGDSLMRELWLGAIERFSGYVPDGDWFRTIPLLGNHLGPVEDKDIGTFDATYHSSKLLCCHTSVLGDDAPGSNDPSRCIYAIQHLESSDPKVREALRRHADFVFHDINEYIDQKILPKLKNDFICMHFSWSPKVPHHFPFLTCVFVLNPTPFF